MIAAIALWPLGRADAAAPERGHDDARTIAQRFQMVERQLRGRDITDSAVLRAMGKVPRHAFVPNRLRKLAYVDRPLPIGFGQTISQPYIVALMTQLVLPPARPTKARRALDIGTGSGYQAAVLAELVDHVYGVEILCPLADAARARLKALGYENVTVRCGDGYRGWPEHAPFDVILVAAAPAAIPPPLIDQLAPNGRLVVPVGGRHQTLTLVEKAQDGTIRRSEGLPVLFVPMTGEARQKGK